MKPIPQDMHAWLLHGYGGPEAMRFQEMAVPQPGPGDLLLRVEVASVNPVDWKIRQGILQGVLALALPRVLGRDCVGIVARAGTDCRGFEPGDRLLAVADPMRDGTHAEYAVVPCAQSARVPPGLAAADAACLGIAGLSAYIPLVEIAALDKGRRVLIHAGAGGVGSIAIQIAKHLGAEVWTTCGGANMDFCAALGADRVIDYTSERFEQALRDCDVVFDTVGGEVHRRSFGVLRPGGLLVHLSAAPIDPVPPRGDVRVVRADIRASNARLAALLDWAAAGVIRAQPGEVFALAQAQQAYRLSASGHARGKLLLSA
ncbi:MAG: NADP-dependent oxidoreductase [Betaproteobacteria bacterium]|nr:NADP-dependent oxidoreductase [Betaproteobacteria bacterium]